MIRHAWTVLAQHVVIDKDTNNVTMTTLEQVNGTRVGFSDQEPEKTIVIPFQAQIVSLWYRSDLDVGGKGRARLKYLGPSGTTIGEWEIPLDLTTYRRLRTRHQLPGIAVERAGVGLYLIVVEHQEEEDSVWTEDARIPLEVEVTLGS